MLPAAFLVLSAFLLALGSVLAKGLLGDAFGLSIASVAPLPFVVLQLLGSIILLGGLAAASQRPLAVEAGAGPLHVAGLMLGIGALGTIMAIASMPAGEASFIFATQPIVILVLAWFLLGERSSIRTVLLCLLALAGVATILVGAVEAPGTDRLVGIVFAAISTLSAGSYVVWMRRAMVSVDPRAALIRVQAVALGVTGIAWVLAWVAGHPAGAVPSVAGSVAALGTGAIYYGLAFMIYLFGLRQMEAGRAGAYLNLVPVFTLALAYGMLGERLTTLQWAGSITVLIGVVLIGRTTRQVKTAKGEKAI